MADIIPDSSSVILPLTSISVPANRQRQKAEADATLIASIETGGLINAILVRRSAGNPNIYQLIAGERRLDAHRKLKYETIRATLLDTLPKSLAFKLELQENLARKQLSWQEETQAISDYHRMKLDDYAGWTQQGTAVDLGISIATVSRALVVASDLADDDVRSCPTFTGAFNLISSRAERARIAAQSRGIDVAGAAAIVLPPSIPEGATRAEKTAIMMQHLDIQSDATETVNSLDQSLADIQSGKLAAAALAEQRDRETQGELIITGDFITWAAGYTGDRFDVLHCDFPYGIAYSGARTRRTGKSHIAPIYNDDPDIYFALVDALLEHQDRLAFSAAHIIFWFDMRFYAWTVEQFLGAGWQLVTEHPLIWTKGYEGIASDVRRRPRHCYETALLFVRGDRKIVKLDKDHFECPVGEKLHLNQKPLPMLKHFLSMYVDEHTAVLDPTCGSGAALSAVSQLKCARFLGVELDETNAEVARHLLHRHAPKVETDG